MIGDSLRKDIRPAKALEMRTIWQKLGAKPTMRFNLTRLRRNLAIF